MVERVPERLLWAVDQLQLKPDDRILEVGCGPGVLAALLCERLEAGSVAAIDRSAHAVALASRRNQRHVSAGKARFEVGSFEDAAFDAPAFDKIVAVNVNLFWTQPGVGVRNLREMVARRGAVYLVYQSPSSTGSQRIVPVIERSLRAEGFADIELRSKNLSSGAVICIVATPGATTDRVSRRPVRERN